MSSRRSACRFPYEYAAVLSSQNLPQGNTSPVGAIAKKCSWQFLPNKHPDVCPVSRLLAISTKFDSVILFFVSLYHKSNNSIAMLAYSWGVIPNSVSFFCASPDINKGLNLKFSLCSHTNWYNSLTFLILFFVPTMIHPCSALFLWQNSACQ